MLSQWFCTNLIWLQMICESMARSQSTRGADATPLAIRLVLFLDAFIPVNADVAGLSADGDDVRAAVAIEIGDGQRFHGHAAVFDNVPGPARAFVIERLVDADAAPLPRLVAEIVPDADDDFGVGAAVHVSTFDGVSPLEAIIDHVAVPQLRLVLRLRVNDNLMSMPGLNSGKDWPENGKIAWIDFAASPVALWISLVSLTDALG